MPRPRLDFPSYRLHAATGQALVTLAGRDYYLGRYKSAESRVEYDRLIGEWVAAGRPQASFSPDLSISELCLAYWTHAKAYYTRDGKPTGELPPIKAILRLLKESYGRTQAAKFGPLALKSLQHRMVERGLARTTINMSEAVRREPLWRPAESRWPP